jgi:biopolymer transport protein TolR
MAMQMSRGNGGGRNRYKPMAEINVTPMVDVMLVLLIVFMVAAPLLTVGVPVDLPKTSAAPITAPEKPLILTIDAQHKIYLQEMAIDQSEVIPRLQAITLNKPDTVIYVRGDKSVSYGEVLELMGNVVAAGFTKVSLISESLDPSKATAATAPAGRTR